MKPPGSRALAAAAWLAVLLACNGAQAQFSMVPATLCAPPRESEQEIEEEFRIDAARHLYTCYPMRIFRGKLPHSLYGVMMVETDLDSAGNVLRSRVVRPPATDEVAPWVLALIKRASPFPAPTRMAGGTVTFTETFFVDKSGLFQAYSLTEGQR